MAITLNVGDYIIVNRNYVNKVLSEQTSSPRLKQTLQTLGSFGTKALQVISNGSSVGILGQSFLTILPDGDLSNSVVYFDSDEVLNRTFSNFSLADAPNQEGYYSVDGQGLNGHGLLGDILAVQVDGTTSVNASTFGFYFEFTTGTTAANDAIIGNTANQELCRVANNPCLSLAFELDVVGTPRFFTGLSVPTATPATSINADATPTVGIVGLWFENGTDTNYQFVANGTGGALTKVDTGIAPSAARLLILEIVMSGNGASNSASLCLRDGGTVSTSGGGRVLATTEFTGTTIMGGFDRLQFFIGASVETGGSDTQLRTYWGKMSLKP